MSSYDEKDEIKGLVNKLVEKLQSTSITTSLPKTSMSLPYKKDIATTLVDKLQNKEKFSDDDEDEDDDTADRLDELKQEREDQDRDILGIEPPDDDDSEDKTDEEEDKEEDKEEESVMKKFKWVLIGIGVFI